MKIFGKSLVLFLLTVFAAQSLFAQTGWQINRLKGTGDLISVFFTSSDDGWIAGDDGFLAFTKDGGKSWNKKILNTAASINEIYFRNDDNGYLVAGRKMFITKDGGKSWREDIIANQSEFEDGNPEFLSIRFNTKKQGFIIGTIIDKENEEIIIGSLLLKTEDGGETWSRIKVPAKVELFDLDFDGKSHGWIVGDMGTILATNDNGNTWVIQNSGTTETLYNVDFRDEKEGFAIGSGGTILRTVDGGNNWISVNALVSENTLFRIDFADEKNGWIVGSKGLVLRSYDRGKSWVRQSSQTSNSLYGLYMAKKYGWSVGREGVIIRYEN